MPPWRRSRADASDTARAAVASARQVGVGPKHTMQPAAAQQRQRRRWRPGGGGGGDRGDDGTGGRESNGGGEEPGSRPRPGRGGSSLGRRRARREIRARHGPVCPPSPVRVDPIEAYSPMKIAPPARPTAIADAQRLGPSDELSPQSPTAALSEQELQLRATHEPCLEGVGWWWVRWRGLRWKAEAPRRMWRCERWRRVSTSLASTAPGPAPCARRVTRTSPSTTAAPGKLRGSLSSARAARAPLDHAAQSSLQLTQPEPCPTRRGARAERRPAGAAPPRPLRAVPSGGAAPLASGRARGVAPCPRRRAR